MLTKHLKRQIISLDGGWKVIADLNAYRAFAVTLRQSSVTPYFDALKMLGNLYIVDNPKELATMVRDATDFGGLISPEDLYEYLKVSLLRKEDVRQACSHATARHQSRSDFKAVSEAWAGSRTWHALTLPLHRSKRASTRRCTASRSARTVSSLDAPARLSRPRHAPFPSTLHHCTTYSIPHVLTHRSAALCRLIARR